MNETDILNMRDSIEKMQKYHQVEILRIIDKHTGNTLMNENNNGVFINMNKLPECAIEEISKYVDYVQKQESDLNQVENEKQKYKEQYF